MKIDGIKCVGGYSQPTRIGDRTGVLRRFNSIVAGTYPASDIAAMQKAAYRPVIIGYDYEGLSCLGGTRHLFEAIQEQNRGKTLTVALEILPPGMLEHIMEFKKCEEEYNQNGTIGGIIPKMLPIEYRNHLLSNRVFGENLGLWLCDHGFNVFPHDSDDVMDRIDEGTEITRKISLQEQTVRQAQMSIGRNIYGIGLIESKRPDIISTSAANALAYELFLGLDGSSSFYNLKSQFSMKTWENILNIWEKAHAIDRETPFVPRKRILLGPHTAFFHSGVTEDPTSWTGVTTEEHI